MLTKLLSRSECAACRLCCSFSGYDTWSTPVLNGEVLAKVKAVLPDAAFLSKGEDAWLFRVPGVDPDDTFPCPLLDPAKGCRLGEEKPFTCRIWPVQIMEIGGNQAITLSPLCDTLMQQPLGTLLAFVKEELADTIFSYVDAHPNEVQPYDGISPVLLWRTQCQF